MIFYKYDLIHVHIPKTAGASIETYLWPDRKTRSKRDLWQGQNDEGVNKYQIGGLQHLKAKHIQSEVGEEIFENFFKFAFVRNPWDRLVSQYEFCKKRKDLMSLLDININSPFDEYLEKIQIHSHIQWERQVDFIYDDVQKCLVDFVGKYETLISDFQRLVDENHFPIFEYTLPHINKSLSRKPYRTYYNSFSKDLVNRLFYEDINCWSYKF